MSLKTIHINEEGLYDNPREALDKVIKPATKVSLELNITAGYFTVDSLLEISEGLENFIESKGVINLIIGIPKTGLDKKDKALIDAINIAETSNSSDEIIKNFEELIISGVKSLESELQKDKIRVVAYLIKDKILNVKFALKKGEGALHQKIFLFRDEEDQKIAAHGSMNSTRPAFIDNIENLSIERDWLDQLQKKRVDKLYNSHNLKWSNQSPGLEVLDATYELGNDLINVVGEKDYDSILNNLRNAETLDKIYSDLIESPVWLEYTLSKSSLYPHQTNAVQEALSMWPMRKLFADEVGLGKTLEVGSCISYAIKQLNTKRILILTPASVVNQWKDELKTHFGLNNFYTLDKNKRVFIDSDKNEIEVEDLNTYSKDFPNFCIMSKDMATKYNFKNIFDNSEFFPEMLVVDEAHHARGHKQRNGEMKPTQFRHMIQNISDYIPHILFASATPMRKNYMEYYFLLQLLGIDKILKQEDYDFTLLDIGKEIDNIDPLIFGKIFEILVSTIKYFNEEPSFLKNEELEVFRKITNGEINEDNLIDNLKFDKTMLNLLIRIHPTSIFTTRHSRDALSQFDIYSFPERDFSTNEIQKEDVPDELAELHSNLISYAENFYLKTETAFGRFSSQKLGVASFKESFVSSYAAAKARLNSRKIKLEEYINIYSKHLKLVENDFSDNLSISFVEEEGTEDENSIEIEVDTSFNADVIVGYAKQEILEINDLLELCHNIDNSDFEISPDPKMKKLIEILKNHFIEEKSTKPILVFSKYLNTLDEAVALTEKYILPDLNGIGIYKGGGEVRVKYTGINSWQKSDREEIKEELEDHHIDIVFCSTAAQEGVNLQSASTLINIDVPWIPSDLEQRIGRIARLGQEEPIVKIFNLWYPDSYEAKIYKRLLERKDLLEIALGKFPEIVADTIKSQTYGDSVIQGIEEMIDKLSSLKEEVSTVALNKLWTSNTDSIEPFSNLFREKLIKNFSYFDESILNFTSTPGKPESVSLRQLKIASIFNNYNIIHENQFKVFTLYSEQKLFGFSIETNGVKKIIDPYCLPELVKGLLTNEEVVLETIESEVISSIGDIFKLYKSENKEWLLPQHQMFTLEASNLSHLGGELKEEYLGTVNIRS